MVADEGASLKQSSESGDLEVIESKDIKVVENIIPEEFEIIPVALGKLKKTLSEKCPECGSVLEIRVFQENAVEEGEEYLKDIEYIVCKNQCGYEREVEPKRVRKKPKQLREEEDDFNGSNNKRRKSTPYRNAKDLRRGNKKSFR